MQLCNQFWKSLTVDCSEAAHSNLNPHNKELCMMDIYNSILWFSFFVEFYHSVRT